MADIQFPGIPKFSPEEMSPLGNALTHVLSKYNMGVQSLYAQPKAEQELQKAKLYNQYYGQDIQSQIGLRGAEAGLAGANAGLATTNAGQKNFLLNYLQHQRALEQQGGGAGGGVGDDGMATDPVMAALMTQQPREQMQGQPAEPQQSSYQAPQGSPGNMTGGMSMPNGAGGGGVGMGGGSGGNGMSLPIPRRAPYGIETPQPTSQDLINKTYFGVDTYAARAQNAREQQMDQYKQYQGAVNSSNKLAQSSNQFNQLLARYNYAMDHAFLKGSVGGHAPALGEASQEVDQVIASMTPEAMSQIRDAMGSGGKFSIPDLNAAMGMKPQRTWNDGTRNFYTNWSNGVNARNQQQQQFYTVASQPSVSLPKQQADALWTAFQNDHPVAGKNLTVNQYKGDEWKDYLTPEAIDSVRRTGTYSPQKKSEGKPEEVPEKKQEASSFKQRYREYEDATGGGGSPLDTLRSVAVGMGKGGQSIASSLTGGYAPTVDMDKVIGSAHPNRLAESLARYSPAILAGGASIPGQMAANGLYGASQGEPGHRLEQGVKDALLSGTFMAAGPGIRGGIDIVKKGYQYLNPAKDVAALKESLAGGSEAAQTSEHNIASLAQQVKASHDVKKADALADKEAVIKEVGKENIYQKPTSQLPEGNLDKVSKIFNKNKDEVTEEQVASLQKALAQYRKTDNLDKFIEKGEHIFHPTEGLSEKEAAKIEDMLGVAHLRKGEYPQDAKFEMEKIQKLHEKFVEKPTFNNADKLQSSLGNEIGKYQELADRKMLDGAGRERMSQLKNMRDKLNRDQDAHLKEHAPHLTGKYESFKKKYRENVVPYYANNVTRKMANKGEEARIKPGDIHRDLSYPGTHAQRVINDVGEKGKGAVIYNKVIGAQDATELAAALSALRKEGGYSKYISPDMIKQAEKLAHRQKIGEYIKQGGASAAIGTAFGHPILGAGLGVAAKFSKPFLAEALKVFAKRK